MRPLVPLLSGLLMALGMSLSGMTRPENVQAFLDPLGGWNPALMAVMASAMAIQAVAIAVVARRKTTLLGAPAPAAPTSGIDRRLLGGAALFGLGWGLAGYCPGPAFAAVGAGSGEALLFVGAMAAGRALFDLQERRTARPEAASPA